MSRSPYQLKIDPAKTTVVEAQSALKPHVKDPGVICPCCHQLVRLSEREITPGMAYVAILLHRHFLEDSGWLHVASYLKNLVVLGSEVKGGDWSKLQLWDLIEEKPEEKGKVYKPGFYRMTERGHQFVKGEIKIHTVALLYNGKLLGFGKGETTIQKRLGKDYNYEDLMSGKLGDFAV
jgi:hypothetical protein